MITPLTYPAPAHLHGPTLLALPSKPTPEPTHTHTQLTHSVPQEDQDWGFVAMVLDRLFLWIFTIASFLGTILILCEAPALYDDTQPIDVEISRVYRRQYLPELDINSKL
uniref:Neurotransmitter-gated ion-channel transmembrane domain-containing protein n=1 Tax=Graphocephala atropunctata TaxID=36148 RepID=A0A1B6KLF8_9HEMI